MPTTGALSGTRGDDLPQKARDTNLNPPAMMDSASAGAIDVNPPEVVVEHVTIAPLVTPPMVAAAVPAPMITPDVSSDRVRTVCYMLYVLRVVMRKAVG